MALCLAATKGRSSSPNLSHVCRKLACLSFAANISVHVRWIPSERNIADGPSRGLSYPSGCNTPHSSHPPKDNSIPLKPLDLISQCNIHLSPPISTCSQVLENESSIQSWPKRNGSEDRCKVGQSVCHSSDLVVEERPVRVAIANKVMLWHRT